MARKSILTVVSLWFFTTTGLGGRPVRKGPFTNRVACETYRMRVAHHAATSDCVAITPKRR